MKIFNAGQLYEADKSTIQNQQISGEQLMERAAVKIFNWLHDLLHGAQVKIHLFCGIGNNGGDGLALARHLWEHGYHIEVNIVGYSDKRSREFLANLERLKDRKVWPNLIQDGSELPKIGANDIIVDAIFGIGLSREPNPWVVELMQFINRSGAFILSVDVPSGLYLERPIDNPEAVVYANHVLSIQAPKLIFFLPQTGVYCQDWTMLDIGMDRDYLASTETDFELIGREEAREWYKPRKRFTHKGSYGHSLIVGGSYGKIGAVALSANACLTAGSGLVTAYVPKCGYLPLQASSPEIMLLTDNNEEHFKEISYDIDPTVIGLGMGMGTHSDSKKALGHFLEDYNGPLVIDADGLNILAEDNKLLDRLPAQTVLTPHPGELKRLLGSWNNDFEKLEKAKKFSEKYDVILVLKDAYTIVIYHSKGYVNSTGNPGMATAGSGDVLTGVITGLIAQGYEPPIAASMAVYLHGRAGDLASQKTGYEALNAGDIIQNFGNAILDLFEVPEKETSEESSD